jgi:hypothetical protein
MITEANTSQQGVQYDHLVLLESPSNIMPYLSRIYLKAGVAQHKMVAHHRFPSLCDTRHSEPDPCSSNGIGQLMLNVPQQYIIYITPAAARKMQILT